jgi:hypothetical protein
MPTTAAPRAGSACPAPAPCPSQSPTAGPVLCALLLHKKMRTSYDSPVEQQMDCSIPSCLCKGSFWPPIGRCQPRLIPQRRCVCSEVSALARIQYSGKDGHWHPLPLAPK